MWRKYSRATFLHVNCSGAETSSRAGQSPLDSPHVRLLRIEPVLIHKTRRVESWYFPQSAVGFGVSIPGRTAASYPHLWIRLLTLLDLTRVFLRHRGAGLLEPLGEQT